MKTNVIIPLLAGSLLLAAATSSCSDHGSTATDPSETHEYVVAVSPRLDADSRKVLWAKLGRLILETARPGDVISVLDGFGATQVTTLSIPNEKVMDQNPRARATRMAPELARLKEFLDAPGPDEADDGALLVPQLVEMLAARPRTRAHASLLLVGSPIYENPKDQVWSFADNRYPSDAHLAANQERTTFGCAGTRADWLDGIVVHQLYPNPEVFGFERHRLAVERFWRRWFAAQGAVPGITCGDFDAAMGALAAGTTNPREPDADTDEFGGDEDKITMLTATDAVPDPERDSWIVESTPPAPAVDSLVTLPVAEPRSPFVDDLRIGVRWSETVDLDLHVRPNEDAEELYFGRPRTSEGIFEKDFVNAPAGVHGFETVRFDQTVDVRSAQVAVNLYRGDTPEGSECEIRVFADGEVFTKTIRIEAVTGTRGKVTDTRASDPAWAVVDLARIVGVERDAIAADLSTASE